MPADETITTTTETASAVLAATEVAFVVVDSGRGTVVDLNAAASRLTGEPGNDVLGRPVWEVLVAPAEAELVRSAFTDPERAGWFPAVLHGPGEEGTRVVWSATPGPGQGRMLLTGVEITPGHPAAGLIGGLLASATSSGTVVTDLSWRVLYCDPNAEAVTGLQSADLLGRVLPLSLFDVDELKQRAEEAGCAPDHGVLPAAGLVDRRRGPRLELGELDRRQGRSRDPVPSGTERRRTPRPRPCDWTVVQPDGSRRTASLVVDTTHDAQGRAVGHLVRLRDVTEERRTRNLLVQALEREQRAIAALNDLDEIRNQFVATVSHEIRTPIANITGYTELLRERIAGELTPSQVQAVSAIHRNADRLIGLIDDLLLVSGAEFGTLRVLEEPIDLRDAVDAAVAAVADLLEGRDLALDWQRGDTPAMVLGDPGQLERMVRNLLTNAVTFTDDGGSVACTVDVEGPEVRLRVADTGIGIPEHEQAHVFEKFFRGATVRTRALQGSGLGLAISRSIVARHGGDIRLESAPGSGTCVEARLPHHAVVAP